MGSSLIVCDLLHVGYDPDNDQFCIAAKQRGGTGAKDSCWFLGGNE